MAPCQSNNLMPKTDDKTLNSNNAFDTFPSDEESGLDTTAHLSKKMLVGEIPIKQQAFLEIIGRSKGNKLIELGEEEIIIGRSPVCQLRLSSKNVSRKHARIFFRNDEYYIEDLGSINGTYVNGIKVVKCALRKNDLIYVGGARILFNE
jgi:pSer/pThr/pTyr-binding forkhead associated (FHA) protein